MTSNNKKFSQPMSPVFSIKNKLDGNLKINSQVSCHLKIQKAPKMW